MSKKIRTTTVTTEDREADPRPPFDKWIRTYLGEMEWNPALESYAYRITVQKYNKEGKPVTDTGKVYEDLHDLPFEIGRRLGAGRYRLYIEIYQDGKKIGFSRILDQEFGYTSEDPADPQAEDDEDPNELTAAQAIAIEERRFMHEKELKSMEIQKEMFIAAMNAKGSGGGMKATDVIELIRTGIALGTGQLNMPADGSPEDPDSIMGILNNPILKTLAGLLAQKIPAAPVAAQPPAQDLTKVE
jgi:hypothetical protein